MGLFSSKKTKQYTTVNNSADTFVAGAGTGSKVTGDNSPMLEDSFFDQSDNSKQYAATVQGLNNSTVNLSDQGAIEEAFQFAREQGENVNRTFADVIGWGEQIENSRANEVKEGRNDLYNFANNAVERVSDSVKSAYQTAAGKETPLDINRALWIAGGALVLVAYFRRAKA